jgi:hypothetical protein
MNNQNTMAFGGSNCNAVGASKFQPNQIAVHPKIIRINPTEPTWMVIHTAILSRGVMLLAASS